MFTLLMRIYQQERMLEGKRSKHQQCPTPEERKRSYGKTEVVLEQP